jgi:hypothetical protein
MKAAFQDHSHSFTEEQPAHMHLLDLSCNIFPYSSSWYEYMKPTSGGKRKQSGGGGIRVIHGSYFTSKKAAWCTPLSDN